MVTSVAWSPDGLRLASGGRGTTGGELFVWDVHNGESQPIRMEHSGIVYAVAWGTTEHVLISASADGKLYWWDVLRRTIAFVRDAHQGRVQALKRSPNGAKLASCGDDGVIMLWDLATGAHLQTLRPDRPYERLNIADMTGLTEAQTTTLHNLGAVEAI